MTCASRRLWFERWLRCCAAFSLGVWLAGCGADEGRSGADADSAAIREPKPSSRSPALEPRADRQTSSERAEDPPLEEAPLSCRRWPLAAADGPIAGAYTIAELEKAYRDDRKATDVKCAGKLWSTSGPVTHVGRNMGGEPCVRLVGSGERFEITCVLRSPEALSNVVPGGACRLQGVYCASIVPMFIHCEVVNAGEGQPAKATGTNPVEAASTRGPPEVTLTADQFQSEALADARGTTRKYAGKIIQLTGRLSRMSHVIQGEMVYRLDGGSAVGAPLGVQRYLRAGSSWSCVRPGQTLTLVGEGFRSVPCLVNCEVVGVAGPGNPTFTAESLGKIFESDQVDFQKRFYLQQLLVSGEVAEKSASEDDDGLVITLRATPATRIICEMEEGEISSAESVRVGESVTIAGWSTKQNPAGSITLVQGLFWRGD